MPVTTTQHDTCSRSIHVCADLRFNVAGYLCTVYENAKNGVRAYVYVPIAHPVCGDGRALRRALKIAVVGSGARNASLRVGGRFNDKADAVLAVTHAARELRAVADAWREVDPKIAARTVDTTLDQETT